MKKSFVFTMSLKFVVKIQFDFNYFELSNLFFSNFLLSLHHSPKCHLFDQNYASFNGWKYDWVDPLGTTSKNNQETKNGQIIFMGPF